MALNTYGARGGGGGGWGVGVEGGGWFGGGGENERHVSPRSVSQMITL